MSVPRSVQALVVGLGPGGASAAGQMAQSGIRVLAIDRKHWPGFPVQCAEFVPLPMSQYACTPAIRKQAITGMKSILPSGDVTSSAFPGLIIDRQAFDAALVERARQASAEIALGTGLVALDGHNSIARLNTKNGLIAVHYQVLIAADGPHSKVARLLKLARLATVNTRQYRVPLSQSYHDTDIWLSDEYPGGYAWLFPKGNVANLGLGADKHFAKDLKTPLDRLHRRLIDEGLLGERILSRTGGLIPVSGLRSHLHYHHRILFVGDAAGLTHPITGAGISAAVISGEAAGQAVVDFFAGETDSFHQYEEDMRDQYEPTLRRAVERRQWLSQYWHTAFAQDDEVMRCGWIAFDEYFSMTIPDINRHDFY